MEKNREHEMETGFTWGNPPHFRVQPYLLRHQAMDATIFAKSGGVE